MSTGGYSYSYDSLGRLTGAGYHDWGSAGWSQPSDHWTEKGLTYTDNGDILTLKRYASSSTTPHDDLSFTYTGARRDGLQYDADGNVASDAVRGFTMEYNFLNLPSKIWVSEDDYMSYTWYYDGTKVSVEGYEESYGADYIGSFVYNNDDDRLIRDIRFGDGIVRETANGRYETLYWVTDHLGSPRVAFTLDDSEYGVYVTERNDYYPFGGRWDDGSGHGGTIAASANRYALSGKERQTMNRMGSYLAAHESLLDFGARFYDPATAIFFQQDPLAEKYYNLSPYAYCANNPVNFVDPDGEFPLASNLFGAALSVAVEYGCQVAANIILKDMDISNALINVDLADIGVAFVEGFVTSGGSIVKKGVTKAVVELAGSVVGNTLDINLGEVQPVVTNSAGKVITDTALDLVGSTIKTKANLSPFEATSNTKAVNKASEKLNAKGKSLDPQKADKIRHNNKVANKEKSAANKALSETANSIIGTAGAQMSKTYLEEMKKK